MSAVDKMMQKWIDNGYKMNPKSMPYRSISKKDGFIVISYKDETQRLTLKELSEILREQEGVIKNNKL